MNYVIWLLFIRWEDSFLRNICFGGIFFVFLKVVLLYILLNVLDEYLGFFLYNLFLILICCIVGCILIFFCIFLFVFFVNWMDGINVLFLLLEDGDSLLFGYLIYKEDVFEYDFICFLCLIGIL